MPHMLPSIKVLIHVLYYNWITEEKIGTFYMIKRKTEKKLSLEKNPTGLVISVERQSFHAKMKAAFF